MQNYKQQRRGKKGSKNWIYGAHLRLNELKFRDIFRATNLQVGELLEDPVGCADPLLESPEGLGTEIILVGGEGEFRGWISWASEQFRRRNGYGRWGLAMGDGWGRRLWRWIRERTFPSCYLGRNKGKVSSNRRRAQRKQKGVCFFLSELTGNKRGNGIGKWNWLGCCLNDDDDDGDDEQ